MKSYETIKRIYYIMAYSKIVYLNIFTLIDEYQALIKLLRSISWLVVCFNNECVVDMDVTLFKSIIFAVKNHSCCSLLLCFYTACLLFCVMWHKAHHLTTRSPCTYMDDLFCRSPRIFLVLIWLIHASQLVTVLWSSRIIHLHNTPKCKKLQYVFINHINMKY